MLEQRFGWIIEPMHPVVLFPIPMKALLMQSACLSDSSFHAQECQV